MALYHDVKINSYAAVAAGTTTITQTTGLDMAGFDGAMFIIRVGTPATNNNIRVQQCDTVSGTYADLAGSLVGNSSTDNPLVVDVVRPKEQFLKYQVTRGTSTTIDALTIIQYNARSKPVTQPSGVAAEAYTSPSEGTA